MARRMSTVFSRIFNASIIPFIIAFLVMFFIVGNIIYHQNDVYIRHDVVESARYISEKISATLDGNAALVEFAGMNMAGVVADTDAARGHLEIIVRALMQADPSIACAYASLPIIALTANAVSGAKDLFIKAGMNDYISKPVQKQVLRTVLAKWLSARRRSSRIVAVRDAVSGG